MPEGFRAPLPVLSLPVLSAVEASKEGCCGRRRGFGARPAPSLSPLDQLGATLNPLNGSKGEFFFPPFFCRGALKKGMPLTLSKTCLIH
jgi:hypothetical protein